MKYEFIFWGGSDSSDFGRRNVEEIQERDYLADKLNNHWKNILISFLVIMAIFLVVVKIGWSSEGGTGNASSLATLVVLGVVIYTFTMAKNRLVDQCNRASPAWASAFDDAVESVAIFFVFAAYVILVSLVLLAFPDHQQDLAKSEISKIISGLIMVQVLVKNLSCCFKLRPCSHLN